jgi:hypothetical protein
MKYSLFFIIIFLFSISDATFAQVKDFIYVKKGRLYHPDGKEVALWGVNLQPCLSWEYNARMKPARIIKDASVFKKMTDQSLDQIELLGGKLIRCHLTPADFTDDKGNLVETIYLDMLDYMISEAAKRGIYSYITFINHMGSGEVENSFMNSKKGKSDYRPAWILNDKIVAYSKNYIKQLLNRENPYSRVLYKNDPSIAIWEIINEPRYFSYDEFKKTQYYNAFKSWLKKQKIVDNNSNYLKYRKQLVLDYINGIYDMIRKTGDLHPITWSCNWHKMIVGHEDVFEAVAESKVEVVSFCNYPGQNVVKSPYQDNAENLTRYDFTEWYKQGYQDNTFYGWALTAPFKNKAKVVYEFETFYNQSAYLYPVMADFMRSLGVQMAAMWHYSMPAYAQYNSGSHILNLETTPQKAAAFAVAGKIFENTPILQDYHVNATTEWQTNNYMYSYQKDMAIFSNNNNYYYSNNVPDTQKLKPGPAVKNIFGIGNSPLVKYNGTGNYQLKISDNEIELHIQPDVKHLVELWQRRPLSEGLATELDYGNKNSMQIHLQNWEKGSFHVYKLTEDKKVLVDSIDKLNFNISPGNYLIIRN